MCVISEAQSQSHFFLTPTNDKIHLSVLNFEKQERQKEVAELEQTISGSKEELSSIRKGTGAVDSGTAKGFRTGRTGKETSETCF